MRSGRSLALAGLLAVFTAACSTAAAPQPGGRAAGPATAGGAVTRAVVHPVAAAPGVAVERLAPPTGSVAAHCPARTLIGTQAGSSVTARTRPDPNAPAIATFPPNNSQGFRQVYDLIGGETAGTNGTRWYRALLPIRPNDTLGYVRADLLHVTWTEYWLLVDPGRFTLTLYRSCRVAARFPVGIGTGSTPTPVGYFYLQSLLEPPDPNGVYGAYAYGLSGYSAVIHDWRWGGLVGLHGTDDPSGIGHLVSHGCIRMDNRDITRLAAILPLGTPITIV